MARVYNGCLRVEHIVGSRANAPGQGSFAPEAESFSNLDVQ